MNFVAVDDRLTFFKGRHQGRESTYRTGRAVFDQDVAKIGRSHFFHLLPGLPFIFGVLVVIVASLFDQVEACFEFLLAELPGLDQANGVLGAGFGMRPFGGPGF